MSSSIVRLAAHATTTLDLLASSVGIGGIGPLGRTHIGLNHLRHPLLPELQLNLLLAGLLDHVTQALTPRETHELPNVIPQHSTISRLPHLLIRNILWNQ